MNFFHDNCLISKRNWLYIKRKIFVMTLLNYSARRTLLPYVPSALRALVTHMPRALSVLVASVYRVLRPLVPYMLSCVTCFRASRVQRTLVPHVPCALRFLVILLPRASRSLLLLIPYLLQVLQAYLNFLQPMVKLIIVIRHFLRNNVFAMV